MRLQIDLVDTKMVQFPVAYDLGRLDFKPLYRQKELGVHDEHDLD